VRRRAQLKRDSDDLARLLEAMPHPQTLRFIADWLDVTGHTLAGPLALLEPHFPGGEAKRVAEALMDGQASDVLRKLADEAMQQRLRASETKMGARW
jgi:hypothetical protein